MNTQNSAFFSVKKVIKDNLKKRHIGFSEISKSLNIKEVDFKNSLFGKRKFKSSEFIAICLYLGLNLEDFKECL